MTQGLKLFKIKVGAANYVYIHRRFYVSNKYVDKENYFKDCYFSQLNTIKHNLIKKICWRKKLSKLFSKVFTFVRHAMTHVIDDNIV